MANSTVCQSKLKPIVEPRRPSQRHIVNSCTETCKSYKQTHAIAFGFTILSGNSSCILNINLNMHQYASTSNCSIIKVFNV